MLFVTLFGTVLALYQLASILRFALHFMGEPEPIELSSGLQTNRETVNEQIKHSQPIDDRLWVGHRHIRYIIVLGFNAIQRAGRER